MKHQTTALILGFVSCAGFGYWLAGTASPPQSKNPPTAPPITTLSPTPLPDEPTPKFRRGPRPEPSSFDPDATAAGALEGQRVLVFRDAAALAEFVKNAGSSIRILGHIDALNALRIGFSDPSMLALLAASDLDSSLIFPVSAPTPPEGTIQDGAIPLGAKLLEWLGIDAADPLWGNGVKVAILDTGVTANDAFGTRISSLNLVPLPGDASTQNGHGTAVASLIAGSNPLTPGVAPSAQILSIRIANEQGASDSFLLAQGILAAIEQGAQLINISMGTFGDSSLVRNAIDRAIASGALIIASSGNNGLQQVTYPAAYDGVIGVGAVDAIGNHLDFSNSGNTVDISAPGYGINAAWSGNQAASVSGTSFSAPIVTGTLAAVMTLQNGKTLTPAQAWQALSAYLNDGGSPGSDPQLGAGTPDLSRVITGKTPGVRDAAVASQHILPADAAHPNGQIEILIQNRGTETLINTKVLVTSDGRQVPTNITTLAPNAVTTVRVPLSRLPTAQKTIRIESRVTLGQNLSDARPANNQRAASYSTK